MIWVFKILGILNCQKSFQTLGWATFEVVSVVCLNIPGHTCFLLHHKDWFKKMYKKHVCVPGFVSSDLSFKGLFIYLWPLCILCSHASRVLFWVTGFWHANACTWIKSPLRELMGPRSCVNGPYAIFVAVSQCLLILKNELSATVHSWLPLLCFWICAVLC